MTRMESGVILINRKVACGRLGCKQRLADLRLVGYSSLVRDGAIQASKIERFA